MVSTMQAGNDLHVEVPIENKTKATFVFPKREILLVVTKDGAHFDTLATEGPRFEMPPGAKMTGKFDRPITHDGTYSWQAKTWYYAK